MDSLNLQKVVRPMFWLRISFGDDNILLNFNINIGKAYRSAQLCDLIGQHELSAEQQDVCETQMPLSTAKKSKLTGFFSKSVTIQAENLGLVLL